jgi:hypothetical protein
MGRRNDADGPTLDPALWRGQPTTLEAQPAVPIALLLPLVGLIVAFYFLFGDTNFGLAVFVVVAVSGLISTGRRLLGRSPWVIVSDEGVAVGNVYTSALWRRNAVRWSDVVAISAVRHGPPGQPQPRPKSERPSVRSAPLAPLKELLRRAVPREFSIARGKGRPLVVRAPLRQMELDDVHAEVLSRWQRFGDPAALRDARGAERSPDRN